MKLKPTVKGLKNLQVEEQPKKTPEKKSSAPTKKQSGKNTLPPDEYRPMFEPIRFLVRETHSHKDATKVVKQYVELSVKRFNDDVAEPHVWLSMFQESEFYTGYLKGKTVNLPLEMLYDLIDNLTELSEKCDKLNIQ